MDPAAEDKQEIPPASIREALARVLDDRRFSRAVMQSNFLAFVVEQELGGHGSRITGTQIAIDVYGKDASYDPQIDRGIAVAANEIRKKLDEYYQQQGKGDPIRIEIPRGAYRPTFTQTGNFLPTPDASGGVPENLPEVTNSPTIAVLPFRNIGEPVEFDSFTQGFSASIAAAITRFEVFRVIAEQSTVHYQGKFLDVRIVGRELGARYLLQGTVQRNDDDIRITVTLSDVRDGTQMWAETMDRNLTSTGLFELQDEVTRAVVVAMSDANGIAVKSLSPGAREGPAKEIATHEAIWLFLQFLNFADIEDFHVARSALQEAADREPDYALTWAGLSLLDAIDYIRGITHESDLPESAWRLANHAVSLNPRSGNVHIARSHAAFVLRKPDIAIAEAEKALALNPTSPTLGGIAGLLIGYSGDLPRGVEIMEHIKQLNPHYPSWMLSLTCFAHYMDGNYEAALADAEQVTLNKWPDKSLFLTMVLGQLGRKDEAATQLAHLKNIEPDFSRDPEEYVHRLFLFDEQITSILEGLRKAGL